MMISPVHAPIIFANGQAYQVQGQFAIPLPPNEVNEQMISDSKEERQVTLFLFNVFQLNAFGPLAPLAPGVPVSAGESIDLILFL